MRGRAIAAAVCAALLATSLPMLDGYDTTHAVATSAVIGSTPDHLGIHSGHAFLFSNWQMWLDRLGANAVRLFLVTRNNLRDALGDSFGLSLTGAVVSSSQMFDDAVSQLRTRQGHDPTAEWPNPVNWQLYEVGLAQSKVRLAGSVNKLISVYNSKNITVQAQIGLSCVGVTRYKLSAFDATNATYWQERWGLYQYVYGLSCWMWNRGVRYIELYNEPEIDYGCNSPEMFVEQLLIRGKAVRDAYNDLNSEAPPEKRIKAVLGAPTTSNIPLRPGTLGRVSVEHMNARFRNGNDTTGNWKNFDEFTYHFYGGKGYNVDYFYSHLRDAVQEIVPRLPVTVTEYNVRFGRQFELTNRTLDSAREAAYFADITAALLPLTKRIFVFKFSQTPKRSPSGVSKNGLLFAENDVVPFNIGGSSRAFEVYYVITQHCIGKKMYNVTSPGFVRSMLSSWAVQDRGNWYLYTVNYYRKARYMSFDISDWSAPIGAKVLVNEISRRYLNQIADITTVVEEDGAKKVKYFQPGDSTVMLTIPGQHSPQEISIPALATAMVAAGNNQYRNYERGELRVCLSPEDNHDKTSVTYLKFKIDIELSRVKAAYLQVHVKESGLTKSSMLILGTSPRWQETRITWSSAPNLKPLDNGTPVKRIADNPIKYRPPPKVAGHISLELGATGMQRVDVTSFLQKTDDDTVSFMISRIVRYNANNQTGADEIGDNSVTFAARTDPRAERRPQLVLFYD